MGDPSQEFIDLICSLYPYRLEILLSVVSPSDPGGKLPSVSETSCCSGTMGETHQYRVLQKKSNIQDKHRVKFVKNTNNTIKEATK